MLKFIAIILVILSVQVYAQPSNTNSWKLVVVDSASKRGLPSVTISVDGAFICMTNEKGFAFLKSKASYRNQVLNFSMIGYRSAKLKIIAADRLPDTIFLAESTINLKEINIGGAKNASVVIGNDKIVYGGQWLPVPEEELAVFIPNSQRIQGFIAAIECNINNALKGIDKPFKIQLYSKSNNSPFPDTTLIKNGVMFYNIKKSKKVYIDIRKYNIKVPGNGFFIVFETLPSPFYGQEDITIHGFRHQRLPALDTDFHEGDPIRTDTPNLINKVYSLQRINKKDYEPWKILAEGYNFALKARVLTD